MYVKHHGIHTLNNDMKLKQLMVNIKAELHETTKASLNVELCQQPTALNFEHALESFRNVENSKHNPRIGTLCPSCNQIIDTNTGIGGVQDSCFSGRGGV